MTPELERRMLQAAARNPNVEVCGYVWMPTGIFIEISNVAKHPDRFFVMDFEEQQEAARRYGYPTACWHSHPNGDPEPSEADTLYHEHAEMRMLIIANGRVHDYGVPGQEAVAGVPERSEGL